MNTCLIIIQHTHKEALIINYLDTLHTMEYMNKVKIDLGLHGRVASREASCEKASMGSFPHAPYVSVTRGTHNQPCSSHLASLFLHFLSSVALAAEPADTPTSNKVSVLSGDVTNMSNAAVLPVAQLVNETSAVWLWSAVRSLPAST